MSVKASQQRILEIARRGDFAAFLNLRKSSEGKFVVLLKTANDEVRRNAIHLAALGGTREHCTMMEYLVHLLGPEAYNEQDVQGWTPLHCACLAASWDIIFLLLKLPHLDASLRTKEGETALHILARASNVSNLDDIIKLMIERGVDINAQSTTGETALHFCALKGNVQLASLLMFHKANVNLLTSDGETPLHWAARYANESVARLLIQGKANVLAHTKAGTAYNVCIDGPLKSMLIKAEMQAYCDLVIDEIYQTEIGYCQDLGFIITNLVEPLERRRMLPIERVAGIFSNIREVKEVNEGLLRELKASRNLDSICDLFIKYIVKFRGVYVSYCRNHPNSMKEIEQLRSGSSAESIKFQELLKDVETMPDARKLSLETFLIKPIQRICKYPLLLREVLKYTEGDQQSKVDVAFRSICHVVDEINECGPSRTATRDIIQDSKEGPQGTLRKRQLPSFDGLKNLTLRRRAFPTSKSTDELAISEPTNFRVETESFLASLNIPEINEFIKLREQMGDSPTNTLKVKPFRNVHETSPESPPNGQSSSSYDSIGSWTQEPSRTRGRSKSHVEGEETKKKKFQKFFGTLRKKDFKKEEFDSEESTPATNELSETSGLKKEGVLQTLSKGSWKRRWFCVKEGTLFSYNSKKKLKGLIPLTQCSFDEYSGKSDVQFSWQLKTPLKTLVLRATNEIEMTEWLNMILRQKLMVSGLSEQIAMGGISLHQILNVTESPEIQSESTVLVKSRSTPDIASVTRSSPSLRLKMDSKYDVKILREATPELESSVPIDAAKALKILSGTFAAVRPEAAKTLRGSKSTEKVRLARSESPSDLRRRFDTLTGDPSKRYSVSMSDYGFLASKSRWTKSKSLPSFDPPFPENSNDTRTEATEPERTLAL
eukprot:TRINITY_DN5534_c0_g1_i3.p1 TRINITY_DN5534_c0_g1~~TRINITY_DN5534_c0_g1_i3.p1  ORF type:complete len:889 (+),score=213.79 TRINITY_DN5534_c0_g1_i3:508-3174(+)